MPKKILITGGLGYLGIIMSNFLYRNNDILNWNNDNDIIEVADALTDLLYVVYGAGHSWGIDLDKCFAEVQRSNMSKLGEDGKPIYNEKGKVMKGPNYFKPNLSKFVKY